MKFRHRIQLIAVCVIGASSIGCRPTNYRVEVTSGQQGQPEVRTVALTPEEQAARERERQVRAALAAPLPPPPEPDLAKLESLWPTLTREEREAILDQVTRTAAKHHSQVGP